MLREDLVAILKQDVSRFTKDPTAMILKSLARTNFLSVFGASVILNELIGDKTGDKLPLRGIILMTSFAYVPLKLIDDYIIRKNKTKGKNFFGKIKNFITNNPLAIAAGIGGLEVLIGQSLIDNKCELELMFDTTGLRNSRVTCTRDYIKSGLKEIVPLTVMTTDIAIREVSKIGLIKKSMRKMKTNKIEKVYNQIYEHPIALGIAAGTLTSVEILRNSEEHRWEPYSLMELGALFVVFMGAGLITSSAVSLAGSLFHSHSLRKMFYKTKRNFYSLSHLREKAVKEQEKLIELPDNLESKIENYLILGDMQSNEKEKTRYYMKSLRLFNKKSSGESFSGYLSKATPLSVFSRGLRSDLEQNITNKLILRILNNEKQAIEEFKTLVEENTEDYVLRYNYGKALEIVGKNGKNEKLKAIRIALKQATSKQIVGGKSKVLSFDQGFLQGEVIRKVGDKKSLEEEIKRTTEANEILKEYESYYTPIPIGIDFNEDETYYAMEQGYCTALDEKIRNKESSFEEFIEVARYTGLINAKIKEDIGKERDLRTTIETRLQLLIDPEITNLILYNLDPCLRSLKPIPKVYNKDARPANFGIMEDGEILGFDFEGGRYVPLTFDTANLLGDHQFLNLNERNYVAEEHRKYYIKNNRKTHSESEHLLAFYNSTILRALEVYAQIIPSQLQRRKNWLLNAKQLINRLETDFPEYYKINKKEYMNLNLALTRLI